MNKVNRWSWQVLLGLFAFNLAAASAQVSPTNSLFVTSTGRVGIGTSTPSSSLHVRRTDGTAQFLVEEASGTGTFRTLFRLINNGNPAFEFDNTAGAGSWRMELNGGAGQNFAFQETQDGTVEMRLTPAGDLTLSGQIFTAGSCSGGCDRVFQPGYELESIEEHAVLMWADSYLPGVGPTPEGSSINLSQKALGILNELEKAHIYLEQLHGSLEETRTELAEVRAGMARQRQELSAEIETLRKMVAGSTQAKSRP